MAPVLLPSLENESNLILRRKLIETKFINLEMVLDHAILTLWYLKTDIYFPSVNNSLEQNLPRECNNYSNKIKFPFFYGKRVFIIIYTTTPIGLFRFR